MTASRGLRVTREHLAEPRVYSAYADASKRFNLLRELFGRRASIEERTLHCVGEKLTVWVVFAYGRDL